MPGLRDLHDLLLTQRPRGTSPNDADFHDRLQPCAIIMYRTGYHTTNSDEKWAVVTEKVRTGIIQSLAEAGSEDDGGESSREAADVWSKLLDFRPISDPSTLEGASHEKLRQLHDAYLQQEGLMHDLSLGGGRRPFFVADTEVLADDLTWIKCVDVQYETRGFGYATGRERQRYFGWFKMVPNAVVDLLVRMNGLGIFEIAPQTIGGMHLVTWDPDEELY